MSEVKNRSVLAQDIMDLYYQDFKEENESFFERDFFERQVDAAYSFLVERDFREMYERLRRDGSSAVEMITFDTSWLKREKVNVALDEETGYFMAQLTQKVFSFPFDKSTVGVQNIFSVRKGECDLVRTTRDRAWIREKFAPSTSHTYWWIEASSEGGTRIYLDKDCCKQLHVLYVPAPSPDLEIQGSKAMEIQTHVLNLMTSAKNGVVIDTTNDSNQNKLPQTEINKERLT